MERVFISHGQQQEKFARALAQHLFASDLEPWLALDAIQPGEAIAGAVRDAAESCESAVLVLGPQEPSSWVRSEWSYLLEAHWRSKLRKLVAVLIDNAARPGFLREAHVIEGSSNPADWTSTMDLVVQSLRLDAVDAEPDAESRRQLRERFNTLTDQAQALEPSAEDLSLRRRELRNLLAHASTTDLPRTERARLLQQLAMLDRRLGAVDEAEPLLREVVALLSDDAPSEQSAGAYYNLGVALLARDNFEDAREVFERALWESDVAVGASHPLTAAAAYNLGWTLTQLGQWDAARRSFDRAVRVGMDSLGPDHTTVKTYRKALEGLKG